MNASLRTVRSKLIGLLFPVGQRLLRDKIPRLTKRQLLLISAFAMLSKIDEPSKELVTKLSQIFELTSGTKKDSVSETMVKMAFLMKDYTWRSLDENGICVEEETISLTRLGTESLGEVDKTLIAGYLADHSPSWLKYGSRDLLVDDFKRILFYIAPAKLQNFQMAV